MKTNAPYSPTLRNLAIPFAAIVPKAVVEADEDAFILNPVGSGPYCFVEWKQGDHVTLKAFDDYYAGKAATENLIMKVIPETSQRSIALETGEIDLAYDLAVNDIPKINDNDKLMVYEIPSLTCWYVSMNMNKEPFNNPLVREALAMAIDRQTIIDTINAGSGQPADAIIAPAVFGYYSTGVPMMYESGKRMIWFGAAAEVLRGGSLVVIIPQFSSTIYWKTQENQQKSVFILWKGSTKRIPTGRIQDSKSLILLKSALM